MPAVTAGDRPNTVDMLMVHRVFRREFGLAPRLVRSVNPGDTARAELVGTHIEFLLQMLHHHHTGEDELVWPKLLERALPETDLIDEMRQQHQVVSALLDRAEELLPAWRATGDSTAADQLATALEGLEAPLDEHLTEEEVRVLPIIEEHLSVAEWGQVGERGLAGIPKNWRLLALGAVLDESSAEERSELMAHVPLPARLAYQLIGRRQYPRYRATLRTGILTN